MKFHIVVLVLLGLNFFLIYIGYDCLEEVVNENFDFDEYANLFGIVILTYSLLFVLKIVRNADKKLINSGLALLPLLFFTISNLNLIHNIQKKQLRDITCEKAGNFELFSDGSFANGLTIEEYNEIRNELPLPVIPLNSKIISYTYRHNDEFFAKHWFDITFNVPDNFTMPNVSPGLKQKITKKDSIQIVIISKPIE